MNRTCRVGVHGRNEVDFEEADYRVIQEGNIETIKMMSHTRVDHFRRLKQMRPDIELITRLFDDRFGRHGGPSPEQFAARMVPIMRQLQPYSTKFEVHNEPNHMERIEGWGDTDADAQKFNIWFMRAYDILKAQCPWAELGFPGLAIPHRDLEWVEICRPAVQKADWLGVHCYWQTPPHAMHNHLADFWGLRFKYYHQKFPDKIIELTEVGNSNVQNGIPFSESSHAKEFTEYLTECFKYPYLNSASFFILSSKDPAWDGFCWRSQDGRPHEVMWAVKDMLRPHLTPARATVAPPPKPAPTPPSPPTLVAPPLTPPSPVAPPPALPVIPGAPSGPPAATPRPLAPPQIQDVTSQLTRNPAVPMQQRAISQINRIIVHHTAAAPTVGVDAIATYQVKQRGYAAVSYHFFIGANGVTLQTNPLTAVTTQTVESHNLGAIGIGFAGNFSEAPPPAVQIEAGARLIAWLLRQLRLPIEAVVGQKELMPTQSPGLHWDSGAQWGAQLRQQIQALLAAG